MIRTLKIYQSLKNFKSNTKVSSLKNRVSKRSLYSSFYTFSKYNKQSNLQNINEEDRFIHNEYLINRSKNDYVNKPKHLTDDLKKYIFEYIYWMFGMLNYKDKYYHYNVVNDLELQKMIDQRISNIVNSQKEVVDRKFIFGIDLVFPEGYSHAVTIYLDTFSFKNGFGYVLFDYSIVHKVLNLFNEINPKYKNMEWNLSQEEEDIIIFESLFDVLNKHFDNFKGMMIVIKDYPFNNGKVHFIIDRYIRDSKKSILFFRFQSQSATNINELSLVSPKRFDILNISNRVLDNNYIHEWNDNEFKTKYSLMYFKNMLVFNTYYKLCKIDVMRLIEKQQNSFYVSFSEKEYEFDKIVEIMKKSLLEGQSNLSCGEVKEETRKVDIDYLIKSLKMYLNT